MHAQNGMASRGMDPSADAPDVLRQRPSEVFRGLSSGAQEGLEGTSGALYENASLAVLVSVGFHCPWRSGQVHNGYRRLVGAAICLGHGSFVKPARPPPTARLMLQKEEEKQQFTTTTTTTTTPPPTPSSFCYYHTTGSGVGEIEIPKSYWLHGKGSRGLWRRLRVKSV